MIYLALKFLLNTIVSFRNRLYISMVNESWTRIEGGIGILVPVYEPLPSIFCLISGIKTVSTRCRHILKTVKNHQHTYRLSHSLRVDHYPNGAHTARFISLFFWIPSFFRIMGLLVGWLSQKRITILLRICKNMNQLNWYSFLRCKRSSVLHSRPLVHISVILTNIGLKSFKSLKWWV